MLGVKGVRELEERARHWSEETWAGWLDAGLGRLHDPTRRHLADRGFPPLELRNDSDIIRQLGEVIRITRSDSAAVFEKIRGAVLTRLDSEGPLEDVAMDRDYWRLLSAIKPPSTVPNGVARSYLTRLQNAGNRVPKDLANAVIEALAGAVASAEASPGQTAFFQRLSRDSKWWRDVFAPLAVDCEADLVERYGGDGLAASWPDIRNTFGPWLSKLADPATPAGRALLRSLARRFAPKAVAPADSEAGARALLKDLGLDRIDKDRTVDRDVFDPVESRPALAQVLA